MYIYKFASGCVWWSLGMTPLELKKFSGLRVDESDKIIYFPIWFKVLDKEVKPGLILFAYTFDHFMQDLSFVFPFYFADMIIMLFLHLPSFKFKTVRCTCISYPFSSNHVPSNLLVWIGFSHFHNTIKDQKYWVLKTLLWAFFSFVLLIHTSLNNLF